MGKNNLGLFFVSGVLALVLSGCRFTANFHEVDPGRLYRSAQLTKDELKKAISKLEIKTIINLRGASPGKDWYDDEKAVADKYGVTHISIPFKASRLQNRRDIIALLDAYAQSARPMLIHCLQGADRTGEAVAMYATDYMNATVEVALSYQTPRTFHFEEVFPAKRYFTRLYQGEEWARASYNPCDPNVNYRYFEKSEHCKKTDSGYEEAGEDEIDEEVALTEEEAERLSQLSGP